MSVSPAVDSPTVLHPAPHPPAVHRERSLGFRLWLAANAWQREISEALVPLKVTPTQFFLLATLTRLNVGGESVTQRILTRQSGVDENTTSQVCRVLKMKGLIGRVPSKIDRRSKLLRLTPEGATLVRLGFEIVERVEGRLFHRSVGEIDDIGEQLAVILESQGRPQRHDGRHPSA